MLMSLLLLFRPDRFADQILLTEISHVRPQIAEIAEIAVAISGVISKGARVLPQQHRVHLHKQAPVSRHPAHSMCGNKGFEGDVEC